MLVGNWKTEDEMENFPVPEKLQKTRYLRRSSTGFIGDRYSNEANLMPNYLKASIGSCHDFCKFGAKHDFKTTEKTPTAPQKSEEQAKDGTLFLQKKSSISSSRPPPSVVNERKANSKPSEEFKQKPLRSKECCISTAKQVRQKDIEISSVNGAASIGTEQKSSAFRTGNGTRNSNKSKETYVPPTSSSPSRKYDGAKVQKKVSNLKGKKNVTSPAATQVQTHKQEAKTAPKKLSHHKSMDNLNKYGMQQSTDEDVPEKIIHVVETKTQNSKYMSSEEKEKQPEMEVPASETKGTLSSNQKARKGDHESESPRKLKFRKGKEIEMGSDNNTGRWLLFRQANLLDNESHENTETIGKKSLKTPDIGSDQPDVTTNEVNEVVLRPQLPIEKDPTQSLYNNVIEKTARNLVKTKKSKVKALVDAFETIISLQDDQKSQGKVKA